MFRVKICGVTTTEDAAIACAAGADAIGLNFYAPSPRYVATDQAEAITASLPEGVHRVGVFVNSSAESLCQTAERVGLTALQLHGDEPAELLAELPPHLPIVRALPYTSEGVDPLLHYVDQAAAAGRAPDSLLVDAAAGKAYGGTGVSLDWHRLAEERERLANLPLLLAGGLKPENVAEAIRVVRPEGVDTASGVESDPGKKDPHQVRQFVSAALQELPDSPI